jgi:hypothetical protein
MKMEVELSTADTAYATTAQLAPLGSPSTLKKFVRRTLRANEVATQSTRRTRPLTAAAAEDTRP